MKEAWWGSCVLLAASILLPGSAIAQTRTRPIDVIAKPAPPEEPRNRISADYNYENFNQDFTPWHWFSVEYGHRFDWGSLIGRVNWARRFDNSAFQYEVDAYPKLTKKTYLYLNFGVAQESYFPDRRYGAEIFFSLPKSFEASGGLRRLEFDDKTVHILTGTVGYYHGNYYYVARPWISNKPGETSTSLSLMMRRYFETRHDYWTLRLSGGQGSESDETLDELIQDTHYGLTFEWQKMFRPLWIIEAKTGVESREYETGTQRQGWLVGVGISRLF